MYEPVYNVGDCKVCGQMKNAWAHGFFTGLFLALLLGIALSWGG